MRTSGWSHHCVGDATREGGKHSDGILRANRDPFIVSHREEIPELGLVSRVSVPLVSGEEEIVGSGTQPTIVGKVPLSSPPEKKTLQFSCPFRTTFCFRLRSVESRKSRRYRKVCFNTSLVRTSGR